MDINIKYGQLDVNATFNNQLCVMRDFSGSGKTFFYHILQDYCNTKGIRLVTFSYSNYNEDVNAMINFANNADIVVLDNADLYLTADLLKGLVTKCKLILISIKDTYKLNGFDYAIYKTKYTGDKLEVKYAY